MKKSVQYIVLSFCALSLVNGIANASVIQIDVSGELFPQTSGSCDGIGAPGLCGIYTGSISINTNDITLHPGEIFGVQFSDVLPDPSGILSISGVDITLAKMHIYDNYDFGTGELADRFSVAFIENSVAIKLEWLFPTTSWDSLSDRAGLQETFLKLPQSAPITAAICDLCGGGPTLSGTLNYEANISPIPLPASLWLFGTAIIGLVGFSKRRKSA